jgi:hypothetical protein
MAGYGILAVCEGGHSQTIRIDEGLGCWFAEVQAGLLDGTSEIYVYPAGTDSVIGKCGICGSEFRCTVVDEADVERGGLKEGD